MMMVSLWFGSFANHAASAAADMGMGMTSL